MLVDLVWIQMIDALRPFGYCFPNEDLRGGRGIPG